MSLSTDPIDEAELPLVVVENREGPHRARLSSWYVLAAIAVLAGTGLRGVATSGLWRDEALSVNIARLPVDRMLDALRQDGHPPGYYVLLHGWMDVFGDGNVAVRSLSTAFSVITLPVAWLAGRRIGGRACALATLVLVATSPFAIRYGSEARMYALVMLLVFLAWLAVRAAVDRPTAARLAVVALLAGLVLLVHYWALYLLAAAVVVLVVAAWRVPALRPSTLRTAGALVAGGALFVPWASRLVGQVGATGTPWGTPARPGALLASTIEGFGGEFGEAAILGFGLVALALLGLCARATGSTSVEIDLRTRPGVRAEVAVLGLTLALAAVGSYLTDTAFAARYASVVFPFAVLAAGYGLTRIPARAFRASVLGAVSLIGLAGGLNAATASRTQAPQLAQAINASAGPKDLVVYCPDQLGPAVDRLLRPDLAGMTFPDGGDPRQVNWVDYLDRAHGVDLAHFAAAVDARAGSGALWLVWSEDYRELEGVCTGLSEQLSRRRGAPHVAVIPNGNHEHGWVYRFGARSSKPSA